MTDKIALITGIRGMDASVLSKLLLEKGYIVYGMSRRSSAPNWWRLETLGILDKIKIVDGDLTDCESIYRVMTSIRDSHPAAIVEIYSLAANSFVGGSWSHPSCHLITNAVGPCNVMNSALRVFGADKCKLYMAGSSEQFGHVLETPQTEKTPYNPRSPYGVSKCAMAMLAKNFRESYNMFICVGLLFNHTCALRGDEFVEQKIVRSLIEWKHSGKSFELGNIESKRDIGHSADFMNAAWMMLQHDKPDDYVVATGETRKISDIINSVIREWDEEYWYEDEGTDKWRLMNYDAEGAGVIAKCNPIFYRPAEVDLLLGDCTKIKTVLGWAPKHDFDSIVLEMVESAVIRYRKGERITNV